MKLMNGKERFHQDVQSRSGIGIGNVKKRLELLYPGKYDLQINDEPDVFVVNMRLELEMKSNILNANNESEKPSWVHSHRTVGRHGRRANSHRVTAARRAEGSRSRRTHEMPEQPQANRHRRPQSPRRQ